MDWDTIYRALGDSLRRRTLSRLPADEQVTVSELARMVVEDSPGTAIERPREDIAIELYHNHLPLLQEAGLVTFDSEQNVVILTDQGIEIRSDVL